MSSSLDYKPWSERSEKRYILDDRSITEHTRGQSNPEIPKHKHPTSDSNSEILKRERYSRETHKERVETFFTFYQKVQSQTLRFVEQFKSIQVLQVLTKFYPTPSLLF